MGDVTRSNCLKEIRATVDQRKPFVLVHEADPAKGGLKLEDCKNECPDEIRDRIFTHCEYDEDGSIKRAESREARARQVVTWMRVKVSARLSTLTRLLPHECSLFGRTSSCYRCG